MFRLCDQASRQHAATTNSRLQVVFFCYCFANPKTVPFCRPGFEKQGVHMRCTYKLDLFSLETLTLSTYYLPCVSTCMLLPTSDYLPFMTQSAINTHSSQTAEHASFPSAFIIRTNTMITLTTASTTTPPPPSLR